MSDKLRVIAGPFHPDLEDALARHIARSRSADPLAPLAVVVPSSLLLARIRELLVVEHEQGLLNVHFLTFHQLALRLYEERIPSDADPSCRLELAGDLFFEHLLSRIALRTMPDMTGLDPKNWTPGAWTSLWATLRDLKDSGVDPAVALQGLAEGLFEEEDRSKLRAVFLLYAAVQETAQSLQIGSANDLAAFVTPWVARSSFLRRLSHVCYYGFYDLTQVQLSLFEAVVATCPTTLYFPLREHAGFTFARRFFDHYLSPLAPSSTQLLRTSSMSAAADPEPQLKIMNTVGTEDELTLVSKEILELVETYGYRFNEIGVVGRTLEGRHDALLRVFDRHCIPFLSSAGAPIMQQPAAKVLLSLAALRSTGFSRERVLDVVASPFYRSHSEPDSVHTRPDLWRVLAGSLGITRGAEEWERVARAGAVETWIVEGDEDDRRPGRKIADAQVRVLWGRVSRLIRDCQALPQAGSAVELTDAFLELLARHTAIPGLHSDEDEPEPLAGLPAVGAAIRAVLEQLKQLDRIESVIEWDEWLMLLTNALTRTSIPLTSNDRDGVRVLDAMAARGLPFRALFLLDLNEQVFPRAIREDGFLRDRHRRVLSETLGYKIDEKLVGYDEEELLFTLLCGAARERLYLVYQRADVDGRPLARSPYLDRFESGLSNEPDSSLPRRFTDRAALPLFSPPLSTLPELGLRLVLEGYDPSAILAAQGHDVELFRHGWRALRNIEAGFDHADAHGGMTGPLEAHWRDLMRRGFSPTSLQQYAKCPFQYFASRVLGLDPVRITALEQLPPPEVGELCHTILRRCGERLIAMGWPRDSVEPGAVRQIVVSLAEEIFGAYTLGHGTGYFVLWQATKETIVRLILASLEEDQRDYQASGFRPVAFEVEAEGVLDADPSQGEPIKIGGRLDRIDLRDQPPAWRIVDYKYRQDVEKKPKDRDLLTAALRGVALQPPLYARMVPADAPRELSERLAAPLEDVQLKFLAPRWEPVVDRASFPAAYWKGSEAEQLRRTLDHFVDGVRSGRFFIMPGGQCDFCEYSAACRRFDASVAVRTYRSPAAKALRRIQKQRAVRE